MAGDSAGGSLQSITMNTFYPRERLVIIPRKFHGASKSLKYVTIYALDPRKYVLVLLNTLERDMSYTQAGVFFSCDDYKRKRVRI